MLPKDILAVIPRPYLPLDFPWEIYQRTRRRLQFLKFRSDNRQDFVRRTSIDSADKRSQTCRLDGYAKQRAQP
jgi:hypothetical protein